MAEPLTLEALRPGLRLKGLLPQGSVRLESVRLFPQAAQIAFRDPEGRLGEALLYPEDLARLEVEASPRFP
ncbi:hypothetical protein, partial [Thermus sp.]